MRREAMTPTGRFETTDGLEWYRIEGYDLLDPFLVAVVTPTDQWMFVSSSGALTAGRRSAAHPLFEYQTDDRLHRSGGRVGPLTVIRVGGMVWEPFADHVPVGIVERAICKTAAGDRLRFEERHPELGLTFRTTWLTTDRFGFVRECELIRHDGGDAVGAAILDGLVDVLPAGVDLRLQQTSSTLVDAYRRSELDPATGLALFTLEARPSDFPEPAESLRANVGWSLGLQDPTIALSDAQVRRFRSGLPLEAEHLVTGRKGGFFVSSEETVDPGRPVRWMTVADVDLDHRGVARLRSWLGSARGRREEVRSSGDAAHRDLLAIVDGADASQETADRAATVHHLANVLFNVMRGGVFLDEHRVRIADLRRFVAGRNREAAGRLIERLGESDPVAEVGDIEAAVAGDADLSRLVAEYLPLSFSRRHGDPSRPWNAFEITVRDPAGEMAVGYEGNWRDIFQNWEALGHSYPAYLGHMVAKFLNASTVDGFNPYRISDRGIDWEVPEEGSWGNYGYWGDHQITYLHRLLDALDRYRPGWLAAGLGRVWLSYADVPYRLLPYRRIVEDPKNTIVFDHERQAAIERRVAEIGADGRLVPAAGGGVHHASLAEKLMVPALSKLSNLVAGGGIWMNTQRPEWNDANNALVGNGVSMVTLYHLREYLAFLDRLLTSAGVGEVPIGGRVVEWAGALQRAFSEHRGVLEQDEISPEARRSLLDAVGTAFSDYREYAYDDGPGPAVPVRVGDLRAVPAAALPFLDQAIRIGRRTDGLAGSYGLMHLEPGRATVEPLSEMLEGQVAAVATGAVADADVPALIDAMIGSDLYRPDQRAFLLYPNRVPPAFVEKNVVPETSLGPGARRLLEHAPDVLCRDAEGVVRFGAFSSAAELSAALDGLLDGDGVEEVLGLYEEVFGHASFTGRSGTMYRYEGLGSVYWHMVSKLLLAIQDRAVAAFEDEPDSDLVAALAERYRTVRAGLGFTKEVAEQGAFPTDPHSHTPGHTGAQQPGMTGQVKEGILLRWGELGVRVEAGRVRFRPVLLDPAEFLAEPAAWAPLGPDGALDAGTLGFTYCGVPVVYRLVDGEPWATVHRRDGTETTGGPDLGADESRVLFSRTGEIARIDVGVDRSALR